MQIPMHLLKCIVIQDASQTCFIIYEESSPFVKVWLAQTRRTYVRMIWSHLFVSSTYHVRTTECLRVMTESIWQGRCNFCGKRFIWLDTARANCSVLDKGWCAFWISIGMNRDHICIRGADIQTTARTSHAAYRAEFDYVHLCTWSGRGGDFETSGLWDDMPFRRFPKCTEPPSAGAAEK